ncbi:alanine racemase [soil metagenome]
MTPHILVDLGAYRQNLRLMKTRVAPAEVMVIVKSDGYGHGLLPLVRVAIAEGIRSIGTLDIDSALELRVAGVGTENLLFTWLLAPDEDFVEAIAGGVDLGVSTLAELERIGAAAEGVGIARLHFKIDTGLHRNGADAADWPILVERAVELQSSGRVELVGVWTHIAEASDEEDSAAIRRFHEAIDVAQGLGAAFDVRHLAASAAAFARADARFDLVRIGAFGYGIAPGDGVGPAELGLVPVMTLMAPVVSVKDGSATIAIGSADGISSAAVGRISVAVNGVRYDIVAVEVDRMIVADPSGALSPSDEAVLFGPGTRGEVTLQEWADATGTIGEEIVTRLSPDIPRTYLNE